LKSGLFSIFGERRNVGNPSKPSNTCLLIEAPVNFDRNCEFLKKLKKF
jgi:hypothetical protein